MALKAHEQITASTWCQGWMARDDAGLNRAVHEEHACRWDLSGWLMRVYGTNKIRYDTACAKVRRVLEARGQYTGALSGWNDMPGRTAEEVRELLKEAGV